MTAAVSLLIELCKLWLSGTLSPLGVACMAKHGAESSLRWIALNLATKSVISRNVGVGLSSKSLRRKDGGKPFIN